MLESGKKQNKSVNLKVIATHLTVANGLLNSTETQSPYILNWFLTFCSSSMQ